MLKELNKMPIQALKLRLKELKKVLNILDNLENKKVAFFNRSHYETSMEIYKIETILKKGVSK